MNSSVLNLSQMNNSEMKGSALNCSVVNCGRFGNIAKALAPVVKRQFFKCIFLRQW